LYFPGGGAVPCLELPGGATGLLPPRYATVPGLRKGNASRCNIKRASLMGAPSQPLRGGTHREGRGGGAPPRTPLIVADNFYLTIDYFNPVMYLRIALGGGEV